MSEVCLIIEDQTFVAKKDVLCEHSDYFRAMFSGSYVENQQKEIHIDVVEASSMQVILQYMEMGFIDLLQYPISTLCELGTAANFLQITELLKQIEYTLELKMTVSNWMEIRSIAEQSSFRKLEQSAALYGLFSFKNMKPEYITSIQKLYWYLSHSSLDADNELDVFKFGLDWMLQTETGADALLIILCCLDLKRITKHDLKEIQILITDYVNSLAVSVVECMYELRSSGHELTESTITTQKGILCEMFTERVYSEVLNLTKESKRRMLTKTASLPLMILNFDKPELKPHFMYTYTNSELQKWLEVAEKQIWGWSITVWGLTKLVVVCGEVDRGSGVFMRDVKIYDVLSKEWIRHGVELPHRRHCGIAILGDSLYMVGGVGAFRVVLSSGIIYDLKERTYRNIAKLPDAIQSPAICAHQNSIYAAGHQNIYRYNDLGDTDCWTQEVTTQIRMSTMISYKGYIYCSQNFFSQLYRFKPGVDSKLTLVTYFKHPPVTICNMGNRLLAFTRTLSGPDDTLSIEEYRAEPPEETPRLLWTSDPSSDMKVNEAANSCGIVMSIPELCQNTPEYHKQYLKRYNE